MKPIDTQVDICELCYMDETGSFVCGVQKKQYGEKCTEQDYSQCPLKSSNDSIAKNKKYITAGDL